MFWLSERRRQGPEVGQHPCLGGRQLATSGHWPPAPLLAPCGWWARSWTGLIRGAQWSTPGGPELARRRAGEWRWADPAPGGLLPEGGGFWRWGGSRLSSGLCTLGLRHPPAWLCSSQHVPRFWGELPGGQHLGGPCHGHLLLLGPQGDSEMGLSPSAQQHPYEAQGQPSHRPGACVPDPELPERQLGLPGAHLPMLCLPLFGVGKCQRPWPWALGDVRAQGAPGCQTVLWSVSTYTLSPGLGNQGPALQWERVRFALGACPGVPVSLCPLVPSVQRPEGLQPACAGT